jgi:hypothetical protein
MKKYLVGLFFVFAFFVASQASAAWISDDIMRQIVDFRAKLGASVSSPLEYFTKTPDLTPRIAYWAGKVNQHVDAALGVWVTDSDGSSGASIDKLTYCKKFYPNTTSVESYKSEKIDTWRAGGNIGLYPGTSDSIKCVQSNPTISPNAGFEPNEEESTPSITVLSPNGGEVFKAGEKVTVKWETVNMIDARINVMLLNGGTVIDEHTDIVGYNQTIFKLPNTLGNKYSFKINTKNYGNISAVSDYFAIINTTANTPSIKILSPNGGETFVQGQSNKISWTGGKNKVQVGLVDSSFTNNNKEGGNGILGWIELNGKINSNITWDGKSVKDLMGNFLSIVSPGKYKILTVSENSIGNYCSGSVVSGTFGTIGPCNFDLSDSYFIITDKNTTNFIKLISPISGSTFKPGDIIDVTWDSKLPDLGGYAGGWKIKLIIKQNDSITGEIITNNDEKETITIPFNTPPGKYDIEFGAKYDSSGGEHYTKYGSATFTITGKDATNSCSLNMINPYSLCSDGKIEVKTKDVNGCTISYQCVNPNTSLTMTIPTNKNTTSINTTRTLKVGVIGDDVKELQSFLGLTPDGKFGKGTFSKVKEWQIKNNLNPDGVFGPMSKKTANILQ